MHFEDLTKEDIVVSNSYMKIDAIYKRTIVVGDIHGCMKELQILLKKIEFSSSDFLISVGDFMDRGPDSWKLAEFFKNTPNACAVCGNHERRIAGVVRGTSKPAWTQLQTLSRIDKSMRVQWAEYFESLPAVIETDSVIVTHARLDPEKSIENQELYHTAGVLGKTPSIDIDENGVPTWYDEWSRLHSTNKPICIGHLSYKNIELVPQKLYALDTAAVTGGQLTALVLPEQKIIQISAPLNYYEKSMSEWTLSPLKGKNVKDVQIIHLITITKIRNKNREESDIVEQFSLLLLALHLDEKLPRIQKKLREKFGAIPEPGAERGEYFQIIKNFSNELDYHIAKHILLMDRLIIERFLNICGGKTLTSLEDELNKLMNLD